ncbi:MAG: proline dehydrogenase family protein [Acidimicrobiales bacterium]
MSRASDPALLAEPREADVLALARSIGELGSSAGASSKAPRTTELMMKLATRLPALQTQLFRFVDVFPAMSDDRDTARHLIEYLGAAGAGDGVAGALRAVSKLPLAPRALSSISHREISRMAAQFIVGTGPAETAAELGRLWQGGTAATVDLLGEHTHSHAEADRYAARLAGLVDAVNTASIAWPENERLERDQFGDLGRVAVSIKPSALAPDFAPLTAQAGIEGAKARLRPILKAAASSGAQVYFDMERYEAKDLTYRLFKELLEEPALDSLRAGIVVQAYLRDSFEDLSQLISWAGGRPTPIAVRLVKGAYWDTETIVSSAAGWPVPVFSEKAETDLNYERCTRALLGASDKVRPAFGSHNLRSLAYMLAVARGTGIDDANFEVQLLYGMAEPVHEAIRRLGLRLRVYAPMGELVPGMAYLVRRLLENTSNQSFVRLRFAEGRPLEALVARPRSPSRRQRSPSRRQRSPSRSSALAKGALGTLSALRSDPSSKRAPSRNGSSGDRPQKRRRLHHNDVPEYRPEPLTPWYSADARAAMAAAISHLDGAERFVPAQIGGQKVQTSAVLRSVNPADPDQVVATTACAGAREVESAVGSCDRAAEAWSAMAAAERAGILFRAAGYIRERRYEVAALETLETGKGWADADGDVCEAIDYLEYYGREALRLAGGGPVQSPPGEVNRLHYGARGVVSVISPWNFPLAIPTGMAAAALVTGNTVVLKPAEQSPAVAAVLGDALSAGGLPPGAFAYLPGYGDEIGTALVTDRRVVGVAFTGSRAVGLQIIEEASRTSPGQREVRRVVAEMGGKNALIIDSDADLDVAVPAAIESVFGFAGQRCSAASRIVVLAGVHDAFIERFVEAARSLRIGPPAEMGTEMGPVIDEEAVERISAWQERAHSYGEVVLRRDDLPERGYFVGPTIVDAAAASSSLWNEEIFGPVVAVCSASGFGQAIELANTGDYALTAGLISRSPSHIAEAARTLRAGNVYINRSIVGAVVGRQPFGGHGMSGVGQKAGGPDYLMQFVQPRVVSENTLRQGFAPLS